VTTSYKVVPGVPFRCSPGMVGFIIDIMDLVR